VRSVEVPEHESINSHEVLVAIRAAADQSGPRCQSDLVLGDVQYPTVWLPVGAASRRALPEASCPPRSRSGARPWKRG